MDIAVPAWHGVLPYPPSVNHYWRRAGHVIYISEKGKAYRRQVSAAVAEAASRGAIEGRLQVTVEVYPPDRRRRDLDNINKALLDALTASGLIRDDSDIKRLILAMRDDCAPMKPGKVIVTVSRICWTQEGAGQ